MAFVQAIPGFAAQFKPVPEGYVDEDRVACPCGRTVLVEPVTLTPCEDCERLYIGAGRNRVYVGYRELPVSDAVSPPND